MKALLFLALLGSGDFTWDESFDPVSNPKDFVEACRVAKDASDKPESNEAAAATLVCLGSIGAVSSVVDSVPKFVLSDGGGTIEICQGTNLTYRQVAGEIVAMADKNPSAVSSFEPGLLTLAALQNLSPCK